MLRCLFVIFLFYSLNIYGMDFTWFDEQIEDDFKIFNTSGITEEMNDQTMEWAKNYSEYGPGCCVRVKVINSKIYTFDVNNKLKDFPAISRILEKIQEKHPLPDLDFVYFHAAGPELINKNGERPSGPVLAGNKTDEFPNIILYHDRVTLSSTYKKSDYDWIKTIDSVNQAILKHPWEQKIEKLFWRGIVSDYKTPTSENWWKSSIRGSLYHLSLDYSDLMDIGLTNFCLVDVFKKMHHEPLFPYANINEHIKYKYQICLDGYTATNPGYAWRLLSNCLTFKVDSPIRQWFYKGLKPWKHYIPVKTDLSDLANLLLWAKQNDADAKTIVSNAQEFAKEYLVDLDILYLYCYKVLMKYASLQKFQPKLAVTK